MCPYKTPPHRSYYSCTALLLFMFSLSFIVWIVVTEWTVFIIQVARLSFWLHIFFFVSSSSSSLSTVCKTLIHVHITRMEESHRDTRRASWTEKKKTTTLGNSIIRSSNVDYYYYCQSVVPILGAKFASIENVFHTKQYVNDLPSISISFIFSLFAESLCVSVCAWWLNQWKRFIIKQKSPISDDRICINDIIFR